MSNYHQFGKAVTVLDLTLPNQSKFDSDELNEIFNHPEVKSRKLVLLSLIGAFRGGKSFFLDYCLRYLYAHFPSIKNPERSTSSSFKNDPNWMGPPNEPLKGFSWKAGSSRVTSGIIMWNDVFLHTLNNEEIAIIIMDTQGLFDNETTDQDNSKIFSLGTLLSSIQVLNLSRQIQEDQLSYLRFATEFANYTGIERENTKGKPFQQLTFLVRDWSSPFEYEYGVVGGNKYLKKVLGTPGRDKDLQIVRESISSSFESINCCLLPNPGNDVTTVQNYDGRWSLMDPKFRQEMQSFIEYLLHPNHVVLKTINSKDVTCGEMKSFIEIYFNLLISNNILKVQNVYDATTANVMGIIIQKCLSEYERLIEEFDDETEPTWMIPNYHLRCKTAVIDMYRKEKKMGNANDDRKYEIQLEEKIESIYGTWSEHIFDLARKNEEKMEAEKKAEEAKREIELIKEKSELAIQLAEERTKAEREKNEMLERENQKILLAEQIQTNAAVAAVAANLPGALIGFAKVLKYLPK
ncbi:atlastin-like [Chironomus tepperi]|uniref:atlastin-like n=1 Tax=Chironomus tepperi TaxID=113505 RepID=UPI00391F2D25